MIKNTKGNKSYTRPLPIRMLAILMAVVMVLSVLYINNSKGKVEALATKVDLTDANISDGQYIADLNLINNTKNIIINVPAIGVGFTFPGTYSVSDSEQVNIYRATKKDNPTNIVCFYKEDYNAETDTDYPSAEWDIESGYIMSLQIKEMYWSEASIVTADEDVTVVRKHKIGHTLKWSFNGPAAEENIGTDDEESVLNSVVGLTDAIKAKLRPSNAEVDDFTVTFKTFAISEPTFAINNETKTVTASDINFKDEANDTETEKYYCDNIYTLVKNDKTSEGSEVSITGLSDLLGDEFGAEKDGTYWLKKNVKLPDSSEYPDCVNDEGIIVGGESGITRNFGIILANWLYYSGNIIAGSKTAKTATLSTETKLNAKKVIDIYFKTDVDEINATAMGVDDPVQVSAKVGGTSIGSLDVNGGGENGYYVEIPRDAISSYLGKSAEVTITLKQKDGSVTLTDSFTTTFTFGDAAPTVSIANTDEYANTDSLTLNAEATVPTDVLTDAAIYDVQFFGGTTAVRNDATEIAPSVMEPETTTVSKDVTLAPGNNYFWVRAESNYGNKVETTTPYNVFYDDAKPTLGTVAVSQSTATYGGAATVDETAKTATLTGKLTSQDDVIITVTPEDFQADESSQGSGINTLSNLVVSGLGDTGYAVTDNGDGSYTYTIPAADMKDLFKTGGTKTATLTVTDVAGNVSSPYTISLNFFNEVATITSEWTPSVSNDVVIGEGTTAKTYFKWDDPSAPKALVKYTITSEVELKPEGVYSPTPSTPATLVPADPATDSYGNYVYTFTSPEFAIPLADGSTGTVKLTVTNINEYDTASEEVVKYIDVTKPTIGDDTSGAAHDVWYTDDVILIVKLEDTSVNITPSGVDSNSITVTGATVKTAYDADTGNIYLKVNESTVNTGTNVTISVTDKVGNPQTKDLGNYLVDKTKPTTTLKLNFGNGDISWENVKKYQTVDPVVTFSAVDDPDASGLDTAVLKVNGTEYPSATSGQKLSEILGVPALSETTEYKIEYVATDVAGNVNDDAKCTIKVDGSTPTTTAKIADSPAPSKGINYFYNDNAKVEFTIVDNNLQGGATSIIVTDNGTEVNVSWSGLDTGNASASYETSIEGDHEVVLKVKDSSGNDATDKKVKFTIDKTKPNIVTKMNGEEYTDANSYVTAANTTSDITDTNKDNNDITTTIEKVTPDGAKTSETKSGVGPFDFSDNGKYTITYKATDKAGNSDSKTIGFTVDNSKPVHNMYITTADPAKVAKYNNTYSNTVGKFSGHSDQEEYTYGQYYNTDVSIDFSFFDYNIQSAQVTDNGSVLPVNWSFNGPYGKGSYTISSEGYHEIVFSSTDKSGNTTTDSGANQKLRFTIDKSAPTISTSLNSVRYSEGSGVRYFNTNGTIDVSVSDANIDSSDLNRINRMTVPGSSVSVSEAAVSEGAETFSTEADYEVQYYAIDRAGNRSDTRTVMFRVDKTAPQLQVSNVGAVSTAGSQNVSFNVKEAFFSDMNNVTIKIYKRVEGRAEVLEKTIDFKPNSANDSTSYTFSEDAEYRIEFTAEDKCGNKSNTDYSFIKDGTAPLITLSGVSNYDKTDKNVELTVIIDEAFYSSNRVTLSGTRTDINGKSNAITFDSFVTNRSKISQLQQLFKEDGIYDITVTSTDKAGNSSSKGVHFTIDTTDPVIGDLSKYDGIRTNSFKWDTNLDELVTDLTVCDIKVYMDGSLYDGTSDVEDGSHVLKIEATDELGHTTTKEVTFVLDSRGPNIIISNVEDGDNLLDSTEVIVTVELDEDSLDTVMLNDKAVEVKDNQAKLTVNKKGKYTLSATAHDEAGNASSAEIKFTFGKQTNLLLIGIIAGILILLLLALLVVVRRRKND